MFGNKSCAILLIIVLFQVCWGQDPSLFCIDQATCCNELPDVTSLGDWNNCSIFYVCFFEVPSPNHCSNPSMPLYNPETATCTAEVDGCIDGTRAPILQTTTQMITTTTTTTEISTTTTTGSPGDGNCTEEGAYFVPYPGDCRKYMICANFILLPDVQECPQGTLFDPDLRECNLESLVECKPVCPDLGTITLPHDKNCSLYWLCSLGTPNLRQCPPGLFYDPMLTTCNVQDSVFCPNLCPNEGTVNLPHSNNCSLYWLCILGDPTLRQCPPDLLFDPLLGQCNLASDVDCGTIMAHRQMSRLVWRAPSSKFDSDEDESEYYEDEDLFDSYEDDLDKVRFG